MSNADRPDVTVIIAAYNASGMIGDAVSSALAQSAASQVIVVDDASSDGTPDEAREADDGTGRLVILRQPQNAGPSAARNRALQEASGAWITILDADDRMEPGRLEALQAAAETHGWDAVADDLYRLSDWSDGAPRSRHWKDENFGELELTFERFVRENDPAVAGSGRELGYIKPLIRKSFLTENGLSYDQTLRLGEDFVLYAKLLIKGARFGLVDPKGYLAFDRPDSLSRLHSAADLKALFEAERELLSYDGLDAAGERALRRHVRRDHKRWAWMRLIEAVRRRDPYDFARTFIAPPSVIAALSARLFGHFFIRKSAVRA